MRRLSVVAPGARTTVEDLGRSHCGSLGVPQGGAFDPAALSAANASVGNPPDAAGLEILLGGPCLENSGDEALLLAVAGADCAVTLTAPGAAPVAMRRTAPPWRLEPGARVEVGTLAGGARAWLAVAGGFDLPIVLGSRSTCVAAGFGGMDGRPLRRGDILPVGAATPTAARDEASRRAGRARSASMGGGDRGPRLRVTAGPDATLWPSDPLAMLAATLWRVAPESDRTGVRLIAEDPAFATALGGIAGIPPAGNPAGAIQVPPDGSAIALGPDRPVTGGYARPAIVVSADLGVLAALRPGDRIRIEPVSLAHALELRRARPEGRGDDGPLATEQGRDG